MTDKPKCRHGNPTDNICLACEKEEERRIEAMEIREEYRRDKEGE